MSKLSLISVLTVTSASVLVLAACTPKVSAPPESVSTAITDAQPLPPAPAAAPAASGAAAPTATAAAATGVGAPGPGMIKLDIKFNGGDVYGNPTTGAQGFAICGACHSIQAGQNLVGPSLHGIIGRHSGAVPGFHYSPANKGSGLVWSEQELYTYLEDPQKTVPGTYMTYTGVKDPQARADVIAYLQQNTK